jgi:dCMP deaminase
MHQSAETRKSKVDLIEAIMLLTETWAACRSKDPNTKVGACVYDHLTGGMFFGYNGFPKGIDDTEERWQRPVKYEWVIHAEENALIKAYQALGSNVNRCILLCTHKPCHKCMGKIIQSGIKVVYYKHKHDDSKITEEMAREALISLNMI